MYIYIIWTRWNGDTTSKSKVFSQLVSAVAVLKGYVEFVICRCWRIFDVILRLTSVILDNMQKRKIMEVNEIWLKRIQFMSWFRPSAAEVPSFIFQKFSHCFSLFLMSQLMYKCVCICMCVCIYIYIYNITILQYTILYIVYNI